MEPIKCYLSYALSPPPAGFIVGMLNAALRVILRYSSVPTRPTPSSSVKPKCGGDDTGGSWAFPGFVDA